MPFKDRKQAAKLLVKALAKYKGKNPLILAIPRGAVPMGQVIAQDLGGELDLILVHKLRAPNQPELAIGALDESGYVYLNPYAQALDVSKEYLNKEKKEQVYSLGQRRKFYTPGRPPIDPKDRVVIVVDDGIATGSTMIAALHALEAKNPAKLIVAVGVASPDTVKRLKKYCKNIVSLENPENFYAVGQFFEDFSQVNDEEVLEILQSKRRKSA